MLNESLTLLSAVASAGCAILYFRWEGATARAIAAEEALSISRSIRGGMSEQINKLETENRNLRNAEEARRARLSEVGKIGRAAQIARRAENAAAIEAQAKAASEKTLTELSSTKLRSRAQVVASVKAKRTRLKKSGVGTAASKG